MTISEIFAQPSEVRSRLVETQIILNKIEILKIRGDNLKSDKDPPEDED